MKRAFAGLVLLVACSAAQKQAESALTKDDVVCILNHDTETPEQIAITCGIASVPDVVAIILAHKAALVRDVVDGGAQ